MTTRANRSSAPRLQCKLCPWKVSTRGRIPNGFAFEGEDLEDLFIADPGSYTGTDMKQQCHETTDDAPLPCVGWLNHQLGIGNNLRLRMEVLCGSIDANVETVGRQHTRISDTLPRQTDRTRSRSGRRTTR